MKYSIIVPYDNKPLLRFSLDSFSHYYQYRDDYEVIIVESYNNSKSNIMHNNLLNIVDKYSASIEIRVVTNPFKHSSILGNYNLGVDVSKGSIIIFTAPEVAHNFDFLKVLDNENFSNTCIVCSCVGVNLSIDRGTFFNSDLIFNRWYQHSIYQNGNNNFCSVLSKDNFIKCLAYDKDKFLDKVAYANINVWIRDDLLTYYIEDLKNSVKSAVDIYNTLYDIAGYGDLADNETKWETISILLPSIDYKTVLDLGCGKGFYLRKFLELDKVVFGVEFSKICCGNFLKDIPHVCADIKDFCKNKKTYDLVLCMDVLEHIEPEDIEETIRGISKKSNYAIIGVANHRDVILDFDLHLIIQNKTWWESKLTYFYDRVNTIIFSDKFYFFKCHKF